MKIMLALLMVWAASSHAWAQDLKPFEFVPDMNSPGNATQSLTCRFSKLKLPPEFVVLAAGAYSGRTIAVQIDQSGHQATQIDVAVNSPAKPVVLMLGAYAPTIWNIGWSQETNVLAVLASGYHRQVVAGLEKRTPTLISTHDNRGPCGYFYITPDNDGSLSLNPLARRVFGRPVDMVYPASNGKVVVGEPISVGVPLVTSSTTPRESFPDKSAPLAGPAGLEDAVRMGSLIAGPAGLEDAVRMGLLRKATSDDVEVWVDAVIQNSPKRDIPPVAGEGVPRPPKPSLHSAYVVLRPFTYPSGLNGATFLIPEGVPRPGGNPGYSAVYDFSTLSCQGALCSARNLERTFRGTINEKWEIQLTLRSTEPISGSYFYERMKKPIPFEARLDEERNWILTEFDDKRDITGQFKGDIFGLVFSGTWTNADQSKSYPFHLIETHRQWEGETSPYRSTESLVAQAKKGKKNAQFLVAFLYHYGQGGLRHNMKEAVGWYKKAAAQGHARAQFILGALYLDGHGVKRDFDAALRLINEAATSGDQRAKEWLADFSKSSWMRPYYEKRQVTKDVQYYVDLIEADPAEAEMGLKALGTPSAKAYLAYMYYEGKATVPNPAEVVNSLLEEALSVGKKDSKEMNTAFYGAINDTFYTVGHSTLFDHMRELAGGVTIPCDIFINNPRAAFEAFGSHYGGCSDSFPALCGDAILSQMVPVISAFLRELGKAGGVGKGCDIGTIGCPIGRELQRTEVVWNMAPQMFLDESGCLGPCEEEATKLGRLRFKARMGLERFFFENYFFTKENAKTLAQGYLLTKERAQDVWNDLYAECPEKEK